MKRVKKQPTSGLSIDGFYKVNIVDPDGTIKGDSGWNHNLITNGGVTAYILYLFGSSAGSSRCAYMMLGSLASSLATNATSVPGAYNMSLAQAIGTTQITSSTQSSGNTVRFLANFVSNSIISASNQTIACIGLFATTNATAVFCGGSFTASTLGSNQAINCTYDIVFTCSAA